jgi:hypothetical protein
MSMSANREAGRECCELFDLKKDPDEFDNVIDRLRYTQKLAELRYAVNHFFIRWLNRMNVKAWPKKVDIKWKR